MSVEDAKKNAVDNTTNSEREPNASDEPLSQKWAWERTGRSKTYDSRQAALRRKQISRELKSPRRARSSTNIKLPRFHLDS
mmetsp:Transcript_9018/g.19114  ORF Transcript_9018/g.19114 Transcript_9018/m.19114 type:complete len:81 (+) Transcript_9018:292-534(+)